tara:strand:- start:351 stop:869 length:519 start_codon:yes stop_codon:yes gene_type:complete
MGSNSSTGGGGGGVGPAGLVTKTGKTGTAKDAKKTSSRNELSTFIKEGGVAGAIIKNITDSAKKSKTKSEANVEVGLGKDRMSNYTVGQGGTRETGGGGNQVVQAPTVPTIPEVTAPTTAEVSQSAATDTVEDSILLRKRKAKARGRSPTILTGVTGVTGSLTLGKPSLLGR